MGRQEQIQQVREVWAVVVEVFELDTAQVNTLGKLREQDPFAFAVFMNSLEDLPHGNKIVATIKLFADFDMLD